MLLYRARFETRYVAGRRWLNFRFLHFVLGLLIEIRTRRDRPDTRWYIGSDRIPRTGASPRTARTPARSTDGGQRRLRSEAGSRERMAMGRRPRPDPDRPADGFRLHRIGLDRRSLLRFLGFGFRIRLCRRDRRHCRRRRSERCTDRPGYERTTAARTTLAGRRPGIAQYWQRRLASGRGRAEKSNTA